MWTCASIAVGFIIDLIVGDPHGIPHPVVGIGRLIAALEKLLRRLLPKTKAGEIAAGAVLWLLVVLISAAVPALILWGCRKVSPWLFFAVQSVMCWQILAVKSLRVEAMKVHDALRGGTLEDARYAVSMIVGRDTERLDAPGVARAAI
jgi:adenosylcobinamide-phosphate synthase